LLEWLIKTFDSIRAQRGVVVDSRGNGEMERWRRLVFPT
jgi:hypothetical protein